MSSMKNSNSEHSKYYHILLTLSALGVVYGDIGTSPLYALKESFHHGHNIDLSINSIFGI
jgi:KUP system potassium uptake protein